MRICIPTTKGQTDYNGHRNVQLHAPETELCLIPWVCTTAEIETWSHNKWKSFKTKSPLFRVQTNPGTTVSFLQWPRQRLFKSVFYGFGLHREIGLRFKVASLKVFPVQQSHEVWERAQGLGSRKYSVTGLKIKRNLFVPWSVTVNFFYSTDLEKAALSGVSFVIKACDLDIIRRQITLKSLL